MAHLPTCLASLRAQTYAPFEIIVVDNGSTDESVAYVQNLVGAKHWRGEATDIKGASSANASPLLRIITLKENRVFVGAVNIGIGAARGALIALLNNDTEAEPTWLGELVSALLSEPQAGMAASKMRLFAQRDTLHNAGDAYRRDGRPRNRGVWQKDEGQFDHDRFVFAPCGGAALYRKTMLDAVGLFDETFIAYCEDVDLAWRAQLAGWRCVYAPRAVVYHKLSATGGGALSSYFVGRNELWVIAKNYPSALWRKDWPRILAAQWQVTREALRAWRGAAARARLRGQLAGLLGLPKLLKKRRAIQTQRKVTDEYLETILDIRD
jgi:GT2 family glycosyltransferase